MDLEKGKALPLNPSFDKNTPSLNFAKHKRFKGNKYREGKNTKRECGITVGDVTPGYPRGGPKCTRPDRVGRADGIPADSIRTVRRAKTTGSFQRCRDRTRS